MAEGQNTEGDLFDDDDENIQENKYLLFHLGGEIYGIPIHDVINIIELQKITEVPDVPNYVKGVINLRGAVIPTLDLRLRFGLEAKVYDDRTCIVIVQVKGKSFGLIVDTVAEVHEIPADKVDPPIDFKKNDIHTQFIAGLGKIGNEVRILLDVNKVVIQEDQLIDAKAS